MVIVPSSAARPPGRPAARPPGSGPGAWGVLPIAVLVPGVYPRAHTTRGVPGGWGAGIRGGGDDMAGFYGADTDALRDVAGLFQERSRRLDELREELTGAVMREDIWIGGDA